MGVKIQRPGVKFANWHFRKNDFQDYIVKETKQKAKAYETQDKHLDLADFLEFFWRCLSESTHISESSSQEAEKS